MIYDPSPASKCSAGGATKSGGVEVARPATEVRQQTKHGTRTRATRSAFQRTSPSLERKDTVGRNMENTLNHFMCNAQRAIVMGEKLSRRSAWHEPAANFGWRPLRCILLAELVP